MASEVCTSSATGWNGMAFLCSRPMPHPMDGKHWGQDRRSMIRCVWFGDHPDPKGTSLYE